jgi:hypothetical protein
MGVEAYVMQQRYDDKQRKISHAKAQLKAELRQSGLPFADVIVDALSDLIEAHCIDIDR